MNVQAARRLAARLDAEVGHEIIVGVNEEAGTIFFCSERTGEHALSIADSDRARVLAHWEGFLKNQPGAVIE